MGEVQAYLDLSMTVLFLILIAIVSLLQNQVSVKLDESIQSAQDYSVSVAIYLDSNTPIVSTFVNRSLSTTQVQMTSSVISGSVSFPSLVM